MLGEANPDKLLEVQLVIDKLKVISFDRFSMKLPSSVKYEDHVQTHLAFYKHYLMKKALLN